MGLGEVPKKRNNYLEEETFAYSFSLNAERAMKFSRIKEVLGGYTNQELINVLIDMAIDTYYDGQLPKNSSMPKKLTVQKYLYESKKDVDKIFGKLT